MQTLDLHAHFPMHLGLPLWKKDSVGQDLAQAALLRLFNAFLNNRAGQFRVTPETILEGGIGALGSVMQQQMKKKKHPAGPGPESVPKANDTKKTLDDARVKTVCDQAKTNSGSYPAACKQAGIK